MKKADFSFTDRLNHTIQVYKWTPKDWIKSIILISHGMTEHANRYHFFAQCLIEQGYGVYCMDHIGHGKTASAKEDLGHFPREGFNLSVENLHLLTQMIKKEHPNTPVILFGHSMGSFFAQNYMYKYGDEINGCILSGTSGKQSMAALGVYLADLLIRLQGEKHKSELLHSLCFGKFNSYFKPTKTDFDWLSRDAEEVNKYINDPYCGFICTTQFYYEFFKGLSNLHNKKYLTCIPKELPIYIFSGDKDPVGKHSKSIKKLIKLYRTMNVQNLEYKLYQDGRHEMLNEINKEQVIKDIIDWLDKLIVDVKKRIRASVF